MPLHSLQVRVKPVISLAFCAFVGSLPFETVDLGIPIELTTIAGGFFLLATLLQPRVCFKAPRGALWWFLVYAYVWIMMVVASDPGYRGEVAGRLFVLGQLLVLCWTACNVMEDEHVARTVLLVFGSACALLALLQILGIASRPADIGSKIERVSALGFHPNNIARILSLGMLSLVGLSYAAGRSKARLSYFLWPLIAITAVAVVQTGSRGGLLALGAGLAACAMRAGSISARLKSILIVLLGMLVFGWLCFRSESTRSRFERAVEEGDMARREQIYPTAWQMFVEKPFAGWGPVASEYELGGRLGHPEEPKKNPHNLLLYLLTSTGLAGTIPMLVGIALVLRGAWRSRAGPHSILPFAMVVTVLVANMSGLWLFNKLHWLVMAYALAHASVTMTGHRRVSGVQTGECDHRTSLRGPRPGIQLQR